MITCPRCGAENKDHATVCRMCATMLDPASAAPARPASPPPDLPATVLIPTPNVPAMPAMGGFGQGGSPGKITCPACQATNDADWAFCQQCGTRLQAPSAAPQPQQAPVWNAPTVVTPPPPMPMQPHQPQAPAWGAPTVVTPLPDFGNQAAIPTIMDPNFAPPQQAPAWGAPTVITPAPDLSQFNLPPQAPPQPPPMPPQPPQQQQDWGAPTNVSPPSSYGQQQQGFQPPQGGGQWGAPTFVSPPQEQPQQQYDPRYAQPSAPPQQPPVDYGSQAETVINPPQPPSHGVGGFAGNDAPTGDVSSHYPDADLRTVPSHLTPSPNSTQDMNMPVHPPPQPAAPPASVEQRTIVMSSSPVAVPPKQARLLLIMEGGDIGETFQVRPSETVIGRVDGDIKFPHDGYMSSRHARILQRNGRFFLIDNNSRNGTFVKIHQEVELHPGDVILIGKQLFRFESDE